MRVRVGDRPGDVGEVIALHARLYAHEYDLELEPYGYRWFRLPSPLLPAAP